MDRRSPDYGCRYRSSSRIADLPTHAGRVSRSRGVGLTVSSVREVHLRCIFDPGPPAVLFQIEAFTDRQDVLRDQPITLLPVLGASRWKRDPSLGVDDAVPRYVIVVRRSVQSVTHHAGSFPQARQACDLPVCGHATIWYAGDCLPDPFVGGQVVGHFGARCGVQARGI